MRPGQLSKGLNMNAEITPVERVMVGLWSPDNRGDTVQQLCGASAYALEHGHPDDAMTLSDCAILALLMMKAES